MLFQLRRKRDTSACTLNRRTKAFGCNICHKQDSIPALLQETTSLSFYSPQVLGYTSGFKMGGKKKRKKKKERRTLMSFQYSIWRCSLRIFPSVHSVVEKILTRYSLKRSKQLYWHFRKIKGLWQRVYYNIQST